MPSHLRNGRDLSGEQRRRYVEAGVANPAGQRPVQRVERQSPVGQSGSDERPGSEPRSGSDTRQLQSDLLSFEIGDVYTGSFTSRPFDGTADGHTGAGEAGFSKQSRIHVSDSLESDSDRRQPRLGDVHQHVPRSTEHVRRSSQDQRLGSHESSSPSSCLKPSPHPSNAGLRPDDGSLRGLASRPRSGTHGISSKSPSESGYQPRTDSHSGRRSILGTDFAAGERRDDLPGSYPSSSTSPKNLSGLVGPPSRAELGALISSNSRAEPCPPSSSERDERVELRRPELDERGSKPRALHQSGRDERTGSEFSGKLSDSCGPERVELPGVHGAERDEQSDAEFCAELRGAVAANPQPTYVRAPQTPSTPAGLTRYFTPRGPYLQRSFESPSESAYQKGSVSLQPQRPTSTPASSSAAARRPLPCSTPTRWKLGEIQEEEENSPTGGQHCPDLGGGNLLLEGRESDGKNSEKRKKKQYSEKKSPQSTQSSI
ncbi:hypothetical protein KEM48_004270, partial [Puccinia striiformis f. sp. tritici PST-130]